jgi:hypothetical protein
MLFDVYRCNGGRREVIRTFDSFAAAEDYLAPLSADYERDADNPGCADAYTLRGDVVSIEPRLVECAA